MEQVLENLRIRFPFLNQKASLKLYKCRLERMKILTRLGLPADVRWIIEAKVRLGDEFSNSIPKNLPGTGTSTLAKKRRARRMGVCPRCARITCNAQCKTKGMISENREDKIKFLKDGLSKESLDSIVEIFKRHRSGHVQIVLLDLWRLFKQDEARYSLGNLTVKDPVCQFIRKLDGKHILDS